jgi:nucleotide-binding universal stress UspA family protein
MAAHAIAVPALFRTIVYATDFSDGAIVALPYVRGIARHFHSRVVITHVIDPGEFQIRPAGLASPLRAQLLEEHDQAVARVMHSPWLQDLECDPRIAEGDVCEQLMKVLRNEHANLLVLGTSGRKGLKRLALGSVAEELFRSISCPVLTVGPHCTTAVEKLEFAHILCPTDFSPAADYGAFQAVIFAQQFGSRLTFVHAVHPDIQSPAERYRITREFAERMEWYTAGRTLQAPVDYMVEFEDKKKAILDRAAELHCDLIVMGIRDAGPLTRLATHLPGATAFGIVAEAPCPVLTFRQPVA